MKLFALQIHVARWLALVLCLFPFTFGSTLASPNRLGWDLLLANKPIKAKKRFEQNKQAKSLKAGEAHRGLAETASFLGEDRLASDMIFKSFLADSDTLLLFGNLAALFHFTRTGDGHTMKQAYQVMKGICKRPGMFNGDLQMEYARRLLNDGNIAAAEKIVDRLGIVRTFAMIGPFENISGSGYRQTYPPEQEINFSKTYPGKNGAATQWFPFQNRSPDGWVFTQYSFNQSNITLYYFTNVQSQTDQSVWLSWGASAAFKVFLNSAPVLADSVFRNTGADMYMQKVRLHKGDNHLLIKLCHEVIRSNFLVRFMDSTGRGLQNVSYIHQPGKARIDTTPYKSLTNSPLCEMVEKHLGMRLAADSSDIDAALMLIKFYNISENTQKGEQLVRYYLSKYPQSSLLHSYHSECLKRARKITDSETEQKTAHRLCNRNWQAWQAELRSLSQTASTNEVMRFLEASYEPFQKRPFALVFKLAHYTKIGNESEALKVMEQLEQMAFQSEELAIIMVGLISKLGNIGKAEKLLKKAIRWNRTFAEGYSNLAALYLSQGKLKKVHKTYLECLRFMPYATGYYFYLARLNLQRKNMEEAKRFALQALERSPANTRHLNLLAEIHAAQGKVDQAKRSLKKAILYNSNDFNAWDKLHKLQGKPVLTTLTKLPDVSTLKKESASWQHRSFEKGAIIVSTKDVFVYPSRCSRERYFLMVYLPTQEAINLWKEMRIPYNSNFQVLSIARAVSQKPNGREIKADMEQNLVVFKALEKGDYMILEWSLANYYTGEMAGHVWGDYRFHPDYPAFTSQLRLLSPKDDTIPYAVHGNAVDISSQTTGDFRIITIAKGPYKYPASESYMEVDPPAFARVDYSTLPSWESIAQWYHNLTENKVESTHELKVIADSLFRGSTLESQKVARVHDYITSNIRYSFVPFRQSGWIPQPAREVLATKIGDCKDMASLAKSFLDHAGIQSRLVLVGTRDEFGTRPGFVGPNFNHCILSYTANRKTRYMDLTDHNLSWNYLPYLDQGAIALPVKKGSKQLIRLPVDKPADRVIIRTISSELLPDGTLRHNMKSLRSGIHAATIRNAYRFTSDEEQRKKIKTALVDLYPDLTLESWSLSNLDTLTDSVVVAYKFTARKAAKVTANTMVFELDIPERVTGNHYPSEKKRHYAIDMYFSRIAIGRFETHGKLKLPKGWKLVTLPKSAHYQSPYGKYSIEFKKQNNTLLYRRRARFQFRQPLPARLHTNLRSFLSKIAQADQVQLLFLKEE